MTFAAAPPKSLLPLRNGILSFASNNPPFYNLSQIPDPKDPDSGRANNQGLEGLTYDPATNSLFALLQSAAINNGGDDKRTNRHTTLLRYELDRDGMNPVLAGEWVVPLPQYLDYTSKKNDPRKTAGASEILSYDDGEHFLVLSRDGGFGRGLKDTRSVYRHIDVISLRNATNILGRFDGYADAFAPGGELVADIMPAEYCDGFVDFNVASELERFGLVNGGDRNDLGLLNEKWEGLAMVPVHEDDRHSLRMGGGREHYLFASSDNDFITQNGYWNGGRDRFKDASGNDIESQFLVFKVTFR